MQEILHSTIIALPVAFAALMILDLIANLNQLWKSCERSTPLSIPVSTPQLAQEPEVMQLPCPVEPDLQMQVDPWLLASELPVAPVAPIKVLPILRLLPPAKELQAVPTQKRKAGRPKKEVAPAPAAVTPKRRPGRPRKSA